MTPGVAAFPMYARPELTGAFERLWADTCGILRKRGIAAPDRLTSDIPDLMAFWQRPDLVLSQTCGYPFRHFLKDRVALVGTPDFALPGCAPGYYYSCIIVRADMPPAPLEAFAFRTFAFNETHSQSGFAAPMVAAQARGFTFANRVATGAHVASARMVAQGQADIAAIDAVSWRHIDRFETWTDRLRVLEHTPPTPGLPFITANHVHAEEIANCLDVAIAKIPATDRGMLGLRSLVRIPREAYLAVADPGTDARSSTPPLSPQPE